MSKTREEMIEHLRNIRDYSFDDCKRLAAALMLNRVDRSTLSNDDFSEIMYIHQFLKDYINLDLDVLFFNLG